jgi:hypothetical protein
MVGTKSKGLAPRQADLILLEYIAGLLALPANATEGDRVALAARVGVPVDAAARILRKSPAAATKALQRARKKRKK